MTQAKARRGGEDVGRIRFRTLETRVAALTRKVDATEITADVSGKSDDHGG
jgi:hypothetical protein